MLNPCKPCVCYGAHCDQCMFGYVTEEGNHEQMKELILEVLAGEKPVGWRAAEDYMRFHPDWRTEFTVEELEIAENKPKTAHWIIEDHGFGGSFYTCSECGGSWCDIYFNVSSVETCPNCDAVINIDENEYVEHKRVEAITMSDDVMEFPGRKPIVHCKDCGYYHGDAKVPFCDRPGEAAVQRFPDDFCSRAIRKKLR